MESLLGAGKVLLVLRRVECWSDEGECAGCCLERPRQLGVDRSLIFICLLGSDFMASGLGQTSMLQTSDFRAYGELLDMQTA